MVEVMILMSLLFFAGLLVYLFVWMNPKFDKVSMDGGSTKILMWYTPLIDPRERKYIVLLEYGWFKKR